jgi:hypothetical protein
LLNRSAIVVRPNPPSLDWLHAVDPTSQALTLDSLTREPTIYLVEECDDLTTNGPACRPVLSQFSAEPTDHAARP